MYMTNSQQEWEYAVLNVTCTIDKDCRLLLAYIAMRYGFDDAEVLCLRKEKNELYVYIFSHFIKFLMKVSVLFLYILYITQPRDFVKDVMCKIIY